MNKSGRNWEGFFYFYVGDGQSQVYEAPVSLLAVMCMCSWSRLDWAFYYSILAIRGKARVVKAPKGNRFEFCLFYGYDRKDLKILI